jgi:ABC-type multidrug transport system ATPase subunit
MGVCAQFDFLYPSLSDAQHVLLYATFRGVAPKQGLKAYIAEKLDMVELGAAADQAAGSYSGGMKRRLSVALATVGNQLDIIFLDEPTTYVSNPLTQNRGLDPLSKRKVWDVIESFKRDRIVVLTSHSMEEADHLSDQISILHGGRIKAQGTPLFLKNRYGDGYQVSILNKSDSSASDSSEMMEKWVNQVSMFYLISLSGSSR